MLWTFIFRTNQHLGRIPLHGMIALLAFTLSGALHASPLSPMEASGATARIENLTKIPGTSRGFPAEDYFTYQRSDRRVNSNGQTLKFTENSKMRIHNDGTNTLVITKLTTSNTSNFTITGFSIPSGGLQVAARSYVDVQVNFVATGRTARSLHSATLVMSSNADNASSVSATFQGAFMAYVEGGNEINVQQVFDVFGFKTSMGVDNNGNLQLHPSSNYPSASSINSGKEGDLILSGMFTQADPNKPVHMIQMAAFHGPGGAPTEFRDAASNRIVSDMKYNHGELYHQTLLPKLTNTTTTQAGDYTGKTSEPFQVLVAGYRSTGGTYANTRKSELLAVRFYKAKDRNGRVIPNEYIVIQDYIENGCGAGSANCDWNDNVSYMVNVRPQALPTARSIADLTVAPNVTKVYPVATSFDQGYPGNKLTYTAGGAPSWATLDRNTGSFTIKPPSSASGQKYAIRVTATDYNNVQVSTVFNLTISGTTTTPPPPPPPPTGTTASYWLEAECAQIGSRWTKETSGSASNGSYVVVKSGNSANTPPADDAANRVRFVVTDVKGGNYQLFARIDAPSGNDDSFWVRVNNGAWYKWYSGIDQKVGFAWNKLPGNALPLKDGTNTVDFAFREDGTRLDKVYLTTNGSKPSGTGSTASNCGAVEDATSFSLEAECGSIGSGWKTFSSSGASNTKYVSFTGDRRVNEPTTNEPSQQGTYAVNLSTSGTYHLFLRVNAPDPTRNSLWVRIDDGKWVKMWEEIGGAQLLTSDFQWRKVNDDGRDMSFSLSSGNHVIRVANREPGTMLDKVYLSRSSALPSGLGSNATNCSSASALTASATPLSVPDAAPSVDDTPELALYPNPVADQLTLSLQSAYEGRVLVILTDLNGRRVRDVQYEKAGDRLQVELTVGELPAGMYHLRVLEGDRQTIETFVKQ